MKVNAENVSLVGLGNLGLCLAAVFAKRGLNTLGVDIKESVVESINQGISPIVEPGLPELIAEVGGKSLKATLNHQEAIEKTDTTFVLVSTPSNPDGSFSNRYVESAVKSLAAALKENPKPYHLFVISSTVMPGSIEKSFIPLVEEYSCRKLNEGFGMAYYPDFVALGDIIKGFLQPELVVIGESDKKAGDLVEAIHHKICESNPSIHRMSFISAELAKVSLNTYITIKISFANTLANICEKIPGSDVDTVTAAIGVDRRISPYYLKGGLAYGGTCFPRDTKAFITFARLHDNEAELIKAVERVNAFQDEHLLELVTRYIRGGVEQTVGVLGLAFKPNTPVITESPSIKLIEGLLATEQDMTIVGYDPLAIENTKVLFNEKIEYVSSAEECLAMSSVCVITTPDQVYKQALETYKTNHPITVIDCWRLLDPARLDDGITYVAWGYAEGTTPAKPIKDFSP